jgi:hypothetical protein
MRWRILAVLVALATAQAAAAAPTCNDVEGRTVRCGTPGAMPVGWKPAPGVVAARLAAEPAGPTSTQMLGMLGFVGGLLALFALMPDFETPDGGGWDRQDGDER